MISFIRKRDGRVMEFTPQKISKAILAAMNKCDVKDAQLAVDIANKIASQDKDIVEIEEIQDMVEIELMNSEYKQVAKEYITYREERSKARRRNTKLNKSIENILLCKSVVNSNANVDEYSFGGRKHESANALQKQIALDVFIRPEVAQAHINNDFYVHDLSEYAIGSHNCLFADLPRLLGEGFKTRNGDVRPANCFATACQLVAVIFQIQSQVQYGGVASAHIDTDLAPFVRKSFIKHYKNGLEFVETDETVTWERLKDDMADAIAMQFTEDVTDENIINNIESTCFRTADLRVYSPKAYKYAVAMLEKEGLQGAQALYHNLNTLESRA